MAILPRSYQIEAVNSIFNYFGSNSGNPIVAMPTATGKSVVIAMFLQSVFHHYPNQRVMVLTHVKELIQQNYEKLITLWPSAPAGVYSAGLKRKDLNRKITFGGIGSVAKRAPSFGHVDLVLIDEVHMVSPDEETLYRKFLDGLRLQNPNIKIIGLTATPWRLGTGHIVDNGLFTDVCFDITDYASFNRLIEEGYLATLIPKRTELLLDVQGVHMRGDEFNATQLQAKVDKESVTHAALVETLNLAHDRKVWLVFASGVDHAIHISDMLNDMGVPAVAIHSKLSNEERDKAIAGYKSGKYRAAVNNNVLTTGFDYPQIDCIVVLRPTASTVLWVQMLGRGTRPYYADGFDLSTSEGRVQAIQNSVKQNCLVLDFAANTKRLGPINDPVIPRKKGEGGGEAPVKVCEVCGTYNHTSLRHCFNCGSEFTFAVKIKETAASDALLRTDKAPIVEVFKVDHITYSRHEKHGRPPMLKATYYCGLRAFTEYACIEHDGFAGRKARQWWRERSTSPFPASTEDALATANTLTAATHLRIWVNKQYPEILAHCFDGTAFGKQEASEPPTVDTRAPMIAAPQHDPHTAVTSNSQASSMYDDDIPF